MSYAVWAGLRPSDKKPQRLFYKKNQGGMVDPHNGHSKCADPETQAVRSHKEKGTAICFDSLASTKNVSIGTLHDYPNVICQKGTKITF